MRYTTDDDLYAEIPLDVALATIRHVAADIERIGSTLDNPRVEAGTTTEDMARDIREDGDA